MTPVPVRSPPRALLSLGVRLRQRHSQRVAVLEPAQRRDVLQRPRRRRQPRHERPDQRSAREPRVRRPPVSRHRVVRRRERRLGPSAEPK